MGEETDMAYEDLDQNTRMSSMRTTASFQRTRLSSDRTLMSSMRTSLSLIGFGFTIFSFFRSLGRDHLLGPNVPETAPALFGLSLVTLGVLVLALGIAADYRFNANLRRQRDGFLAEGILRPDDLYPRSWVLLIAFLLLLVGLAALFSILVSFIG
ncbi:DUF202 domain-containing protein [Sandaracinobacter sp. RS1-74]|uniref:YidH family protein n=1 Tax=Sandaracinobacteroides sayramensis TaxID=2913411 RepID=UPI001EDBB03C|nr:DUF202 domain-containing protein [Sandaracinobacteroides sayramensis]MCG2841082.1 DUF202 domain-containing protein [Sandaracinobacteroides sayramensis]